MMHRKRGRDVWWFASLRKQGGSGVTSAVGGTVYRWDYMTVSHSVRKSASVGGLELWWCEFLAAFLIKKK